MDLDRPAALDYSIPVEDLEIHRYLSGKLVCICKIFAAVDTGAIEITGAFFRAEEGAYDPHAASSPGRWPTMNDPVCDRGRDGDRGNPDHDH